MIITKSGNIEEVDLNKVRDKIKRLSEGLNVNYDEIAIKTVNGIFDGVNTNELDKLSEMHASTSVTKHYDYNTLATRLFVSNLHDNTESSLLKVYGRDSELYKSGLINDQFMNIIEKHHAIFQEMLDYKPEGLYNLDYNYDYMGITTLAKSYLLKVNNNNILHDNHKFYDIQQKFIKKEITNKQALDLIRTRILFMSNIKNVTNQSSSNRADKYVNICYNKYIESYSPILTSDDLKQGVIRNKNNDKIAERPTQMMMRVAIQVRFMDDDLNFDEVRKVFNALCNKWFIHATPTLFNSGTKVTQLASCFLQYCGDSAKGITKVISDSAIISKYSGGIGITMSDLRSKGSYIAGTGGYSDGIIPFNKILNDTGRAFNQGGGKRKGSIAIYLEVFHADILDLLKSRMDSDIDENLRCKDLFIALWVCDLFMEKLINDDYWYLMCPNQCPGLTECYDEFDRNLKSQSNFKFNSDEFDRNNVNSQSNFNSELQKSDEETTLKFTKLYNYYVENKRYKQKIKARDLFTAITNCLTETGLPYILFKDSCNRKSNQKNLGIIKQSNLCAEIIEYTDENETAVCNLGNMGLQYIMEYTLKLHNITREMVLFKPFDMNVIIYSYCKHLYENTKLLTRNLDNVIDRNFYPTKETQYSNFKNRPIGIGFQGLQDVFIMLGLEFTSVLARKINSLNSAVIYYAALEESCLIAKERGYYQSYPGSPISKGIIQPHMWGMTTEDLNELTKELDFINWNNLLIDIKTYGVRNSLLIALAPTQTTSHILGSVESFEPITSVMFAKENLSGNFQIFNKHFQRDMDILNLWNEDLKNKIIVNDGKVTNIQEIPLNIRNIYKSIWEIKQTDLIQMDADRGRFVDQSHSSNRYVEQVNNSKIYTIIKTAWEKGLKTGSYYLRSKASSKAIQFSVDSTNTSSSIKSDVTSTTNTKKVEDFKKWLADSKKKAETGECEACQ